MNWEIYPRKVEIITSELKLHLFLHGDKGWHEFSLLGKKIINGDKRNVGHRRRET